MSVINPIHEATDELRHYRYVRYIADFGQLPVQSGEEGNAQAHHPPLYYATAALTSFWVNVSDPLYEPEPNPYWGYRNWEVSQDNKNLYIHGPQENFPYRDAALASRIARWTTLLWGAGAVALTYATAYQFAPKKPALQLAAVSIIAFNSMFIYLGAAVNNDVPAGLAGAAITYVCMLAIKNGLHRRYIIWMGILYGAAMLVKFNLLAMAAPLGITLLIAPLPAERKRTASTVGATVTIAAITSVISGWWYMRNTLLYGEPTGFIRLTEIWGLREPSEGVSLTIPELQYAWTSLWGRFGYGQIPLPTIWYTLTAVVCGVGLVGVVVALLNKQKTLNAPQGKMLIILGLTAFVNFLVLYAYITVSPAGAMGRFVFPGLPAFAVLIAFGLTALLPRPFDWSVAGVTTTLLAAVVLVGMFGFLRPAYSLPPTHTEPANSDPIQLGEHALIHSVDVSTTEVNPGGRVDVTITWEVLQPTDVPYTVFAIVQTPEGLPLVERYTYTGLGSYPSHYWQPGDVFTETYRMFVSETAIEYENAELIVGLFHPERGRLPIAGTPNNAITAATVDILPAAKADYPNPISVNWADHFELVGYEISDLAPQPGEWFMVTLYWKALDVPPDEPYLVFLHIKDPTPGWNVYAGNDGNPVTPDTLTTSWETGEVYKDERPIQVPEDMVPGVYELELGWFSAKDGDRLFTIDVEDGNRLIDNWLPLHQILIEAP